MGRLLIGVLAGVVLGISLGFAIFGGEPIEAGVGIVSPGGVTPVGEATRRDPLVAEPDSIQSPGSVTRTERRAPTISDERVAELVAGVDREEVSTETGDGEITGSVKDQDGAPLAGVVLRASRQDLSGNVPSSQSVGREAPQLSLDESVRAAAQRYHVMRAHSYEARTGNEGAFRFDQLPDASFRIRAFKEGYDIQPRDTQRWNIATGAVVDFTAKAIISLPVTVLLPDGAPADKATIVCGHKNSSRGGAYNYAWTPGDADVRLPVGKYKVQALYGMTGSGSFGRQAGSDMHSNEVEIELVLGTAPERVELVLEGRSGIRGRITYAAESLSGGFAQVHMLPLAGDAVVDLKLLAQSDSNHGFSGANEYSFLDLAPGRYVVGVSRSWSGPIAVHQVVDVGSVILKCDLEVPPIDPSQYLLVRAFGSDGDPVAGVNFSFRFESESGGSSMSSGMQALSDPDGAYYFAIPDGARAAYYSTTEVAGDKFTLEANHTEFGSKSIGLSRGQAEVMLNFAVPAQLEVTVTGYLGSAYIGRVSVNATKVSEDRRHNYYGGDGKLDANGVRRFDALEPGEYEVVVTVQPKGERWEQTTIATEVVQLRAGENALTLAMPTLYSLGVHVPEAPAGTDVRIMQQREEENQWGSSTSERTDENGRVQFEDLPAGQYMLQAQSGGKHGRMKIEVPSGDIVFSPDK